MITSEQDINIQKTVCFTGHRPKDLFGYLSSNNKFILSDLRSLIIERINEGYENFISGMALGIDTWSAQIILELKQKYHNINLICAIPCKEQYIKWPHEAQIEWKYIVSKADYVHYVSEGPYTSWCMQKRNEWMVDHSNVVIGVWTGSAGGTANCIKYATKKEKIMYIMNPKR